MSRQLEASRLADSSEATDLAFVRSLQWRVRLRPVLKGEVSD